MMSIKDYRKQFNAENEAVDMFSINFQYKPCLPGINPNTDLNICIYICDINMNRYDTDSSFPSQPY